MSIIGGVYCVKNVLQGSPKLHGFLGLFRCPLGRFGLILSRILRDEVEARPSLVPILVSFFLEVFDDAVDGFVEELPMLDY